MIRENIYRAYNFDRFAILLKQLSGQPTRWIIVCATALMIAVSGTQVFAQGGGEGEGGPGAYSPKSTKIVSQSSFVDMSPNQLFRLLELDEREDTQVVIEGFPANQSRRLITVTITARTVIRILIRNLTNVEKDKTRTTFIEKAIDVVVQRQNVLLEDLLTIQHQISQEKDRNPLSRTPRLEVLKEEEKQLRIRVQKIRVVRAFLDAWAKYPVWGK